MSSDDERYGNSPQMLQVLQDMRFIQQITADNLRRAWLRAEMKRAYALLADW